MRDEILATLCDIPTILSGTQRVLAIFEKSEKLHNYSTALYVAVLQALTLILEYFMRKATTKILRAVGQQSSFERSLSLRVGSVRLCSNSFNDEATLCFHEMSKRDSEIGWDTNNIARCIYQEVDVVSRLLQGAQQEQARINVEITDIARALCGRNCSTGTERGRTE